VSLTLFEAALLAYAGAWRRICENLPDLLALIFLARVGLTLARVR
jgi:hypothetical protein